MKKKIWIPLLILVILVFVTLVIVQKKRDARPFNHYEFPSTLVINNYTDYRADTLSLYLANKILNLDTLNLTIVYIPDVINDGEMEFYGIVQMLPFEKNQFIMLLSKKKLSLGKLKETISHEFVHIDQYISRDLIVYPGYAMFKGDSIVFKEVKYEDRPFEKDAFKRQDQFKKELEKLLY